MSSHPELLPIDVPEIMKAASAARKLNVTSVELEPDAQSRLVFLTDPHGLAVERYKLLRRQLCASSPQGGLLLVSSPSPGDGKTLTSINLAFCLAAGGHSTCLVDFDFRCPGVCPTLKLETGSVLDVMEGRAMVSEAVRQVGKSELCVLGMRPQNGMKSPRFESATLRPFFSKLRSTFTWVIVDMAPAIPFSDVPEVIPEVDGALLVIRAGKTEKSLINRAFEAMGNKVWGVVLNDAVVSGGDYYGYYERRSRAKEKQARLPERGRTSGTGLSILPKSDTDFYK